MGRATTRVSVTWPHPMESPRPYGRGAVAAFHLRRPRQTRTCGDTAAGAARSARGVTTFPPGGPLAAGSSTDGVIGVAVARRCQTSSRATVTARTAGPMTMPDAPNTASPPRKANEEHGDGADPGSRRRPTDASGDPLVQRPGNDGQGQRPRERRQQRPEEPGAQGNADDGNCGQSERTQRAAGGERALHSRRCDRSRGGGKRRGTVGLGHPRTPQAKVTEGKAKPMPAAGTGRGATVTVDGNRRAPALCGRNRRLRIVDRRRPACTVRGLRCPRPFERIGNRANVHGRAELRQRVPAPHTRCLAALMIRISVKS